MSATDWRRRASPIGRLLEQEAGRWTAAASLLLVSGIALFLLSRRLSGAISSPPSATLFATSVVLCTWASAMGACNSRWGTWAIVVMTLVAVSCSYPGNRLIDWVVWLPAIALSWSLSRTVWPWRWWRASSESRIMRGKAAVQSDVVLQELTRTRTDEGSEVVSGTLFAEFSPGERTVGLHVGFCPPFEKLPHCEAHAVDPASASVKIAQALHHGARIEVRLVRPTAGPRTLAVEFAASDGTSHA